MRTVADAAAAPEDRAARGRSALDRPVNVRYVHIAMHDPVQSFGRKKHET